MEKLAALLPAMVSFHECDVQEDCTRLLPSLMAVGPKRCVVVPFFYAALFALCTGLLFEGTSETSFNFAQDQCYLLVAAAVAFGAALVIGALNSARWFQLTGVAAKDAAGRAMLVVCLVYSVSTIVTLTGQTRLYPNMPLAVSVFPHHADTLNPVSFLAHLSILGVVFPFIALACVSSLNQRYATQLSVVISQTLTLLHCCMGSGGTVGRFLLLLRTTSALVHLGVLWRLRGLACASKIIRQIPQALFVVQYMMPLYITAQFVSTIALLVGFCGMQLPLPQLRGTAMSVSVMNAYTDEWLVVMAVLLATGFNAASATETMRAIEAEQARTATARAAAAEQRRFLQYICHEMRVPLNGIVLALEDSVDSREEHLTENLETMKSSAGTIAKLLNDFLRLEKLKSGKLEFVMAPLHPRQLLTDVSISFRHAARARGIKWHVVNGEGVPDLALGDARRIQQVLGTFASNAIKFTREGGSIVCWLQVVPANGDGALHISRPAVSTPWSSNAVTPSPLIQGAGAVPRKVSDHEAATFMGRMAVPALQFATLTPVRASVGEQRAGSHAGTTGTSKLSVNTAEHTVAASAATQPHSASVHVSKLSGLQELGSPRVPPSARRLSSPRAASIMRTFQKSATGARLLFVVDDNGIGLSADDQTKLFRPFEQIHAGAVVKGNGTGLGLAICKQVVELWGGEIGCESIEGVGSRFWFTVPLLEATPHSPKESIDGAAKSPYAATVLQQAVVTGSIKVDGTASISTGTASVAGCPADGGTSALRAGEHKTRSRSPRRASIIAAAVTSATLIDDSTSGVSTSSDSEASVPDMPDTHTVDTSSASGTSPTTAALVGCGVTLAPPTRPLELDAAHSALVAPTVGTVVSSLPMQTGAACGVEVVALPNHPKVHAPAGLARARFTAIRHAVVVDDTPSNRLLLARMVSKMGVGRVSTAANGVEALALVDGLSADVWFIDRNMPVMGGVELTRELRARGYTAPCIGITADAVDSDLNDFLSAGLTAVAVKPVTRERLEGLLDTVGLPADTA